MRCLSRTARQRTSGAVPNPLFDIELRGVRRNRAFRRGFEPFLHERAFAECLERIGLVRRNFGSALLIGCPDPAWAERLAAVTARVDVFDPGREFAQAAGGRVIIEDQLAVTPGTYDLCLALGTLDTVNDLPQALARIRLALAPEAFFLGAMAGGDMLPQLRSAMRAADRVRGIAAPHVHPRVEAAALAGLLSAAGFTMPVVDVDRVQVSYETLGRLVGDLRAMAATNVLNSRPREPLSRAERDAAAAAFASAGQDGRTTETFEILHFAAWSPGEPQQG